MINWIETATRVQDAWQADKTKEASLEFRTLLQGICQSPNPSIGPVGNSIVTRLGEFFITLDKFTSLDVKLLESLALDDQEGERTIVAERLVYKMAKSVHEAHQILAAVQDQPSSTILNTLRKLTRTLLDFIDENIRELLPEATQDELDKDIELAMILRDPNSAAFADLFH